MTCLHCTASPPDAVVLASVRVAALASQGSGWAPVASIVSSLRLGRWPIPVAAVIAALLALMERGEVEIVGELRCRVRVAAHWPRVTKARLCTAACHTREDPAPTVG